MRLTPRFEAALVMATQLHSSQLRKGTEVPYVSHLLGVSSLVLEHGGTEDQAIAALLHDAVEDQGGMATLNRIREEFGDTVADIVDQCTDSHGQPRPEWRQRKEEYIAAIPHKTPLARLVTTADKLHNARAILKDYRQVGEDLWGRFTGKKDGTLWYYRSLVNALGKAEQNSLTDELRRTVDEMEKLASGIDG